jgi:AraC-like DNA-binding protein
LILARAGNISEIAYAVGFNSLDGFSHAYRKAFGESPSADSHASSAPAETLVNIPDQRPAAGH